MDKAHIYSYSIDRGQDEMLLDQYSRLINPYMATEPTYNFTVYPITNTAVSKLCDYVKELPDTFSCTMEQTIWAPPTIKFTLKKSSAFKVMEFMDSENKKVERDIIDKRLKEFYSMLNENNVSSGVVKITPYEISIGRGIGKTLENGKRELLGAAANAQKKISEPLMPKKVIYSGGKTIVIWSDDSKTIVSCMDGDEFDEYAGFCAAVVKKLYGSTTNAKRIMNKNIKNEVKEDLSEKTIAEIKENLDKAVQALTNSSSLMGFAKRFNELAAKSGIDYKDEEKDK